MALTDGAKFQGRCPIFTEVQRLLKLLGVRVPPYLPIPPYHQFTYNFKGNRYALGPVPRRSQGFPGRSR